MAKIVAVYHKDCPDGTTAAACLMKKYPQARAFPLLHSHTKEELDTVLMQVDSETECYTLDCVMGARELATRGKSLTIIDHHEGVEAEMRQFSSERAHVSFIFDNEHSGAALAWKYFQPDIPVPELVTLVEDVDLWKRHYGERSMHLSVYMMILRNKPQEVIPLLESSIEEIIRRGADMTYYADSLIQNFLGFTLPVTLMIGGHSIPLYNTPFFDTPIGNMMSEKHNCVSGVFDIRGEKVRLSFRSNDTHEPSALEIATTLGGGGHRNAAGASVTRDTFLKMLA